MMRDRRSVPSLVDGLTSVTVLLFSAWLFSSPLRASGDLLAYAQDDFYYYLVVARNLVRGLGSTFDGTTLTNGYHPLYLVLFWGVCHFITSSRGIFKFLAVLDTASAVAIFLATRAFFRRRFTNAWLPNAFALGVLGFCVGNLYDQMEVTLTLPLGFLFICLLDQMPVNLPNRSLVTLGFVASLLILSRLDAALLVALCGILAVVIQTYRSQITWSRLLALMAGLVPLLLIYLVTNEMVFHRLTPISGEAKQLKVVPSFNLHPRFHDERVTKALFVLSLMVLIFVILRRNKMKPQERLIYTATAAFPIVHWGLNLSLSDWQIWPWYSYSFRFVLLAFFAGAGAALTSLSLQRSRVYIEATLFALSLLVFLHKHTKSNQAMQDIAAASRAISVFADTHPGRYAMGDRAGTVGYLSSQPTIQTEGLMMDNAYLAHIKKQDSLRDVLKMYRVDYYISFNERRGTQWKPIVGCVPAREPAQGGPNSDVMSSTFCEPPVWEFIQSTGQTLIFKLKADPRL